MPGTAVTRPAPCFHTASAIRKRRALATAYATSATTNVAPIAAHSPRFNPLNNHAITTIATPGATAPTRVRKIGRAHV